MHPARAPRYHVYRLTLTLPPVLFFHLLPVDVAHSRHDHSLRRRGRLIRRPHKGQPDLNPTPHTTVQCDICTCR
ncbi:MAG: hypothetical protein J3Q66DRAFT_351796 [Benniella sp.]|nr:MAG: hypothetical protein J3Q66DRAFT_351796 [Benniella sp.]